MKLRIFCFRQLGTSVNNTCLLGCHLVQGKHHHSTVSFFQPLLHLRPEPLELSHHLGVGRALLSPPLHPAQLLSLVQSLSWHTNCYGFWVVRFIDWLIA